MRCSVCNHEMKVLPPFFNCSVTSDNQFVESDVAYAVCSTCGNVCIDPKARMDHELFYRHSYELLLGEDVEPVFQGIRQSKQSAEFLMEFLENSSDRSFIDIGAGKGTFLETLYFEVPEICFYGLEPSKSFLELEKKQFLTKSYNQFFSPKLFKDRIFDYVSAIGVLEHVDSPRDFLDELSQIMHHQSILFIEVPNFLNNKYDLLTFDHITKFTPQSLTNLFHATGFEVIKLSTDRGVFMRYLVQKDTRAKNKPIITPHIHSTLASSKVTISNAIKLAERSPGDKIAVYGQGIILNYLLGIGAISFESIDCIIDDNPLYHGKKYKDLIDIVSFETFKRQFNTRDVFLAMNECYHQYVLPKLPDHRVLGA